MNRKILKFMIMMITAICFYHITPVHRASAEETTGTISVPLSYITVTQYPSKTTYTKGESLDFSGMILQGYYLDGTTGIITDYTITGYNSSLIGLQNVYISYQGHSTSVTVTVIPSKVANIKVAKYSTTSVSLIWDAVPEASYYEIYLIDQYGGNDTLISSVSTNSTTLYYPTATAVSIKIGVVTNSGGMIFKGILSDPFIAATAPEGVTGLTVNGTSASTVSLSWNPVPGATGYVIYRSSNSGNDYSVCSTTTSSFLIDQKLSSGKAYQYKVSAYAATTTFTGAVSNIVDISTNPSKMTIKIKTGEKKVRLTWAAVTGATYYDIFMGDGFGGYQLIATTQAKDACSYIVEGLAIGQTYDFYGVVRRVYKEVTYQSEASKLNKTTVTEVAPTSTSAKLFPTEEDFMNSSSYNDITFFKKYVKYSKSYVIPGLINTNVLGFTSTSMCPQGITFAGSYLLMTAYDMASEENSVIYVMNKKTKKLLTTLVLPSKTHAGGIAYDGTNIWVTNGKKISAIPFSQVKGAIKDNAPYFSVTYSSTCTIDITASYMTYYDEKLWVGTYNELEETIMYCYFIEQKKTKPEVIEGDCFVMPTRVQGVAFTEDGKLILSRSCQLYSGLRGYIRQLDIYQPDLNQDVEGVLSLGELLNTVEMPSMNEGIAIDGSYIYVLYESAAFKNASYQMDYICAFKLTSLMKKVS